MLCINNIEVIKTVWLFCKGRLATHTRCSVVLKMTLKNPADTQKPTTQYSPVTWETPRLLQGFQQVETCTSLSKGSSVSKFPWLTGKTELLWSQSHKGLSSDFKFQCVSHPAHASGWVLCLKQRIKRPQDQRCSDRKVCLSSWKAQLDVLIQSDGPIPASEREQSCALQVQAVVSSSSLCFANGRGEPKPCGAGQESLPRCWGPLATAAVTVCCAFVEAALCGDSVALPKSSKLPFGSIPCRSWGGATSLDDVMSPANEF